MDGVMGGRPVGRGAIVPASAAFCRERVVRERRGGFTGCVTRLEKHSRAGRKARRLGSTADSVRGRMGRASLVWYFVSADHATAAADRTCRRAV